MTRDRAKLPSLRSRLILLALSLLAPALLAAALALFLGYGQSRREVEKHLQETSRALSLVVDRQFGQAEALLWSLSASRLLRAGDYAAFDGLAREAVRIPGAWVVVEEPGRQVVNTRLPAGTPLPAVGTEHWKGLRPGQIRISNLFTGIVAKQPSVAVDTLVEVGDGVQRYVSVVMLADTVNLILADQGFPPQWNGAILDRNGVVVARFPHHERFVGRSATGDNLERVRSGVASGVYQSVSLDGVETALALSRSATTGWTTIVAVPRAELTAGIRQLGLYLGSAAALLGAVGAAMALRVAGRITGPVDALAADAAALEQGRAVGISGRPGGADFLETAALREAFARAAQAVAEREAERARAASLLQEANATLEEGIESRTRELAAANASLRASQAVLAEREALYSTVFRFNADGLFVVRVDEAGGLLVEAYNPAIETLMGRSSEEAAGLPLERVVPPALLPLIEGRIRECLGRGEPISYERSFSFASRRGVWAVTLVPIRDPEGRIVRVLGSNRDITREREAEAEVKASRDRYEALFEHSPLDLVVIQATPEGGFVYEQVNPQVTRSLGIPAERILGRTAADLFPPEMAGEAEGWYRRCVETRAPVSYELRGTVPAGEVVRSTILVPLLDRDGHVTKILATTLDVTETRRMEERLRRSERMETVGQLTGGIAHDFNNLLTVVMGNLDMLKRAKPDRAPRMIENALAAAEQGRRLTAQLLAFSRRQPLKPEVVAVAPLIARMDGMLAQSLRGDIEIEIDVAEGLWDVEVDATQLQSTLINLAVNARDAMPRGGRFSVRARNRFFQDGSGAEGVAIQVSDTGVGIEPEHLPRVFEPFFTTKEVGQGTGLGLAQVYGFVQQSGGTIDIMSEPGRGTTLTLVLPRATGKRAGPPAPAPEGRDRVGPLRILLVEDNLHVAALANELLTEAGHRVTGAATGREALSVLTDDPGFDFVFSDLVMPGGLDGLELALAIRQRWPTLPILLATGYSTEASRAQKEGFRLLAKPYEPSDLFAAIAELAPRPAGDGNVIPLRSA